MGKRATPSGKNASFTVASLGGTAGICKDLWSPSWATLCGALGFPNSVFLLWLTPPRWHTGDSYKFGCLYWGILTRCRKHKHIQVLRSCLSTFLLSSSLYP